jgi:hypothetical protein
MLEKKDDAANGTAYPIACLNHRNFTSENALNSGHRADIPARPCRANKRHRARGGCA